VSHVTTEQTTNAALAHRARQVIPGGVNSGNRALAGMPLVIRDAHGAYFTDVEGTQYLDYHAAFGPIILGHSHPAVHAAVARASAHIDLMGVGVTEAEILLAEKISAHVPSAERVLLANSGSEATYQALRLARAVTSRHGVVKFQGTYHGWHDAVAMNVISAADKIGTKDLLSGGMLPGVVDHTHILPFNDVEAITDFLEYRSDEIAAVLVEVIPHNIGCVLPRPEFLQALRALCDRLGCLLIFDEVITGFRHSLGGYQKICGVTPDLSTFAKAMANGYPIAALVGRARYMQRYEPGGGVFFAGTYNGHPHCVAAALATIAELEADDGRVHTHCFALAQHAADGLQRIADELGIPMTVARFGSVFVPYFIEGPIVSYTDLLRSHTARDVWFRSEMCARGVFMLPVALKRNHVSAAHTKADVDRTLEAARDVLRKLPS
jgi:glutamate-1-semialdehyde 2,1-aminomutase